MARVASAASLAVLLLLCGGAAHAASAEGHGTDDMYRIYAKIERREGRTRPLPKGITPSKLPPMDPARRIDHWDAARVATWLSSLTTIPSVGDDRPVDFLSFVRLGINGVILQALAVDDRQWAQSEQAVIDKHKLPREGLLESLGIAPEPRRLAIAEALQVATDDWRDAVKARKMRYINLGRKLETQMRDDGDITSKKGAKGGKLKAFSAESEPLLAAMLSELGPEQLTRMQKLLRDVPDAKFQSEQYWDQIVSYAINGDDLSGDSTNSQAGDQPPEYAEKEKKTLVIPEEERQLLARNVARMIAIRSTGPALQDPRVKAFLIQLGKPIPGFSEDGVPIVDGSDDVDEQHTDL